MMLAITALYIATRDRWRWKRLAGWGAAGALALVTLGAFAVYVADRASNQPEKMNSLWDIALGASQDDVLFLKGAPTEKEGNVWHYYDGNASNPAYLVKFDPKTKRVRVVGTVNQDPSFVANGINPGQAYEAVLKRLGKPDHISSSEDKMSRLLSFKRYGMAVGFSGGAVEYIAVWDGGRPERLAPAP